MSLGYEQLRALKILREGDFEIEASDLAKQAGCSWEELFELAKLELVDISDGRMRDVEGYSTYKTVHPLITLQGLAALETAEKGGAL
jgi:hypothetical protein